MQNQSTVFVYKSLSPLVKIHITQKKESTPACQWRNFKLPFCIMPRASKRHFSINSTSLSLSLSLIWNANRKMPYYYCESTSLCVQRPQRSMSFMLATADVDVRTVHLDTVVFQQNHASMSTGKGRARTQCERGRKGSEKCSDGKKMVLRICRRHCCDHKSVF